MFMTGSLVAMLGAASALMQQSNSISATLAKLDAATNKKTAIATVTSEFPKHLLTSDNMNAVKRFRENSQKEAQKILNFRGIISRETTETLNRTSENHALWRDGSLRDDSIVELDVH